MSEYILDTDLSSCVEKIVRCRDCSDYMQNMSHAASPTERRCRRLKRWVEPDDYCALPKQKEGAE